MKRNQLLTVLLFLLVGAAAQAQSSVLLAFNLQAGKTYSYGANYDINQEIQGQKIHMRIEGLYDLSVTGVAGDNLRVRSTYRRMAIAMELPTMSISGDSDHPLDTAVFSADAMMDRMLHAILEKSFYMTVSREGEVLAVDGVEEMTAAVFRDMNLPADREGAVRAGFERQFNAASLKESFSQAFNLYPNKVVKAGDSWKRSFRSQNTPMSINTTYTVKAIKGDLVMVDVVSDLELTGEVSMKGTQSGNMVLETATGLTRSGELRQSFNGDMIMNTVCTFSGRLK
ncbi:MAG: hypothetical protein EOO12_11485 [Chitinophagaceae bacterium]|nr:MAG: hypothetical protein EOO12_11485 [Chitinophagaceae bacterium]